MPVIEVLGLTKRYGQQVALEDLTFTVEAGEIFGIVGPNGAGKTTTVECIIGLRQPDHGRVRVLGLDPRHDRAELRQRVGAQLQACELPERLTVSEALELYASFYRKPANPTRLIAALGLEAKRDTPFAKLSGGQQQRLSIALALVGNPEIVVLDELTAGLDPQARRATWELVGRIRDSGVTVLLVTHFMDEAERLCDRIAIVDRGRLVAVDTPTGLIARARASQRIRLRPSAPFDDRVLKGLREVRDTSWSDGELLIAGTGDLLRAVTSTLLGSGVAVDNLHFERPTLEDAYLALTGRAAGTQ